MSEDTTKELPETDNEKLTLILTGVQALTGRVEGAESLRPLLHKVVDDISQLREGQNEVRADISQLREGQNEIRAEVAKLREGQIEGRADILKLQEGQNEVRADISQLREGQRALSTEVRALRRDVDHQFGNLYSKLVVIEVDHRDIHDRVTRLELNTNPPNTQT